MPTLSLAVRLAAHQLSCIFTRGGLSLITQLAMDLEPKLYLGLAVCIVTLIVSALAFVTAILVSRHKRSRYPMREDIFHSRSTTTDSRSLEYDNIAVTQVKDVPAWDSPYQPTTSTVIDMTETSK